MNRLIGLLTQPSGIKGIVMVCGLIGVNVSPELVNEIGMTIVGAISVVEMFRDEYRGGK